MTRLLCWTLLLALTVLAGCASRPVVRDGAEDHPPPDLMRVPDAAPRVERIRAGGPNKPYDVEGQRYEPVVEDRAMVERGLASWYGKKFHGKPTSSGEVYNMYAMTAAHATMPIPSYARVRNPANGREVIVRINDRGPFHKGRIIDLSYTAALKLDVLRGVTPVEVERITYEDIRTGAWMRGRSNKDERLPVDQPVYAAAPPVGAPELETTTVTAAATPPSPAASSVTPSPLPQAAAPGFWVQLGAFARLDGAEAFREKLVRELADVAPLLAIFKDRGLNRLQAGPYATRADAQQAAEKIRQAIALAPVVVERK
ncbi:septal ring lytic transglycosylase RlpA family protein [Pelomonas sp. KK5]|uniref:septal ring lytic transglycosylase RlpA family protein n=1 Tax=Pelomonas sp. KK5 TaxID=1855730 RepID=UPI00097BD36C|nr:septal ring lytic transglycosylase RlpA family protein [Pelomonas sp. KK5]